jgi:hypothetical protein
MKTFSRLPLLITILVATLGCSGCMQPVEASSAVSTVSRSETEPAATHRCRSGMSQSTQKGCRTAGALARN